MTKLQPFFGRAYYYYYPNGQTTAQVEGAFLYLSTAEAVEAHGASGKPSALPPSSGRRAGCCQCSTRPSAVSATRLAAVFTSKSPKEMPPANLFVSNLGLCGGV